MKTIFNVTGATSLAVHLAQPQTTLAYLWKVKRTDGTKLGFTNHDLDIVYNAGDGDGSITYLAATGFSNTATSAKSNLSVDNLEVTGFLESDSITESDLRGGLYDDAAITIMVVNWNDLTMGHLVWRSGTLGIVKMVNGLFTAEIRGLAHKLTTILGSLYGPTCRAQFGSGLNGIDLRSQWLCKIDVTAYRQTGSLSSITDARTVVPNSGLVMKGSATPTAAAPAGWFNNGIITYTSGPLSGQSFEIKTWDGTTLVLYLPMPYAPAPLDTFTIEPGCDHSVDDCNNKFSNIENFRGEPFIPGMDAILQTPDA